MTSGDDFSSCVSYRVCCFNSTLIGTDSIKNNGAYCYISRYYCDKDCFHESSISKSTALSSSFYISDAKFSLNRLNASFNEANNNVVYYLNHYSQQNDATINFCTFLNNSIIEPYMRTHVLFHKYYNHLMDHCNVINNNCSQSNLFAVSNAILNMEYIVISGNNAGNIFLCINDADEIHGKFISIDGKQYNVSKDYHFLRTDSIEAISQLKLNLSHYSTGECKANLPINHHNFDDELEFCKYCRFFRVRSCQSKINMAFTLGPFISRSFL